MDVHKVCAVNTNIDLNKTDSPVVRNENYKEAVGELGRKSGKIFVWCQEGFYVGKKVLQERE